MYDYLIVGSALYGSIFDREATNESYKCLVIDKRNNVGGNISINSRRSNGENWWAEKRDYRWTEESGKTGYFSCGQRYLEKLIKGYIEKQWGRDCKAMSVS